jgi:sugar diacid utilization regulator
MAVALHHAEQRAAAHARTHTIDGVAWDLLEGREQARAAAAAGARQLQIDLSGPLRVLHLFCAERSAGNERMPTVEVESRRGFVRQIAERVLDRLHVLRLVSARGNLIVAVVVASDVENLKEMIKSVDDSISRSVPGLRTCWGISSKCRGAKELHTAHREAASALILANKLGQARNIAIYDQLGIVGLLLKVRNDIDLETYVANTLGKVLAYDSGHHGVLTKTVRTYFECNCSQKLTAQMLHVHEKTVRYRLGRFEALSKLDLGRHEDRLRIDLALSMEAITPEAHSAGDKSATL